MAGLRSELVAVGGGEQAVVVGGGIAGGAGHGLGNGAGADGGAGVIGDLAAVFDELAAGQVGGFEFGELGDPGRLFVLVFLGSPSSWRARRAQRRSRRRGRDRGGVRRGAGHGGACARALPGRGGVRAGAARGDGRGGIPAPKMINTITRIIINSENPIVPNMFDILPRQIGATSASERRIGHPNTHDSCPMQRVSRKVTATADPGIQPKKPSS